MELDHILLIGYGGPRTSEEVMPFLKGMMHGRNIPEAVLKAVARNYEQIGGASPYSKEVIRFAEQWGRMLGDSGINLPVYVGMKNWHPFLEDVLPKLRQKGHRKGLAIILNAFPGAVTGAKYKESLRTARAILEEPAVDYVFQNAWHEEELFIEAQADEIRKVLEKVPADERKKARILFTFHSLPARPEEKASESGYPGEALAAAKLVAQRLGYSRWEVVYQSKPAHVSGPWLGPDINKVIERSAKDGIKRIVAVPLGFFCDHVEILFDLDVRARETAERMNMEYLRAGTVIHGPKIKELFLRFIRDAVEGSVSSRTPRRLRP